MDCSRPGASAHGIFQGRVLEWGAISKANKRKGSRAEALTPVLELEAVGVGSPHLCPCGGV